MQIKIHRCSTRILYTALVRPFPVHRFDAFLATAIATMRRSYGADMAGDDPEDPFDSSDLLCKNSRDLL